MHSRILHINRVSLVVGSRYKTHVDLLLVNSSNQLIPTHVECIVKKGKWISTLSLIPATDDSLIVSGTKWIKILKVNTIA